MRFITQHARRKSIELAESRGTFPGFKGSLWERRGYQGIRNATLTTIAPTGTLSLIAGCSSGIEPMFGISYLRRMSSGALIREVNPTFIRRAKAEGFYSEELIGKISRTGSIKGITEIPAAVRRIFPTALDIGPVWHVRMQAIFQKYCDNAVSKTVNLPENSTVEDVKNVFMLAHRLGCKGITVFRYGSRRKQVLCFSGSETDKSQLIVPADYTGTCTTKHCIS